MTYLHRPATPDDLPAIVDIYNAAVAARTSTADLDPVSIEARRRWFEEAKHPIWVGHRPDDPDTVTGYLSFEPFLNGRRGYDVTLDLAIYLHPEHRGRGQGRDLLGAAVAHAPRLGARTLATTIFGSNEASLRLFRSFGFQEWGRLPAVADLDGVWKDLVIVGLKLQGCPVDHGR
ncbi:GNAT family N-acetyltransferase [Kutzneria buriramensis]|uniref:Phosphinothricin acetyltransferase n=1 Tax=Kutzneria buriramensis TaxID=1045776 RepID=A0A3E0GXA4_9PSEU|nr:GNAT family N-acetyltransferase [Kutzneria buriramensis]REH33032.1 phosphinothricin acetyltransferase [Kutzneria buriramensis]